MDCEAFVLAGGRSARMGRDKALLPWRNGTLLEHMARVASSVGPVTVIGPPERYHHLSLRVAHDLRPGDGPLAGLETALTITQSEQNLILACDLPGLTPEILQSMAEAALAGPQDCLMAGEAAEGIHALCGFWRRRILGTVSRELDRGTRSVADLLEKIHVVWWPLAAVAGRVNLNTPSDVSALASTLDNG